MEVQIYDKTEFEKTLVELENKLSEFDANLLQIAAYCSAFLNSSKETKETALKVAKFSLNAALFFNELKENHRKIGKMGEKLSLALVLGSILFAGFQHIKERKELLEHLDKIRAISLQNYEGLKTHLNMLAFTLGNISSVIDNKINRIIYYLAKEEPPLDKYEILLKTLHRFVLNYLEFNQRYRVYQAYKEVLDQYLKRENFLKVLNKEKAEEAKRNYLNDWKNLIYRLYQGENSLGSVYYKIITQNVTQNFEENKQQNNKKSRIFTVLVILIFTVLSFVYSYWLLLVIPFWFGLKRLVWRRKKISSAKGLNTDNQTSSKESLFKQIYDELVGTISKHVETIEKSYFDGNFQKEKLFEVYEYLKNTASKKSSKTIDLLLRYFNHLLDFEKRTVNKDKCLEYDAYILFRILEWYNFERGNLLTLERMFNDDQITKFWIYEKIGKRSIVTKIASLLKKN